MFGAVIGVNTQGGATNLYVAGNAEINYSSQALCRIEQSGLLPSVGVSALDVVSGSWMQL